MKAEEVKVELTLPLIKKIQNDKAAFSFLQQNLAAIDLVLNSDGTVESKKFQSESLKKTLGRDGTLIISDPDEIACSKIGLGLQGLQAIALEDKTTSLSSFSENSATITAINAASNFIDVKKRLLSKEQSDPGSLAKALHELDIDPKTKKTLATVFLQADLAQVEILKNQHLEKLQEQNEKIMPAHDWEEFYKLKDLQNYLQVQKSIRKLINGQATVTRYIPRLNSEEDEKITYKVSLPESQKINLRKLLHASLETSAAERKQIRAAFSKAKKPQQKSAASAQHDVPHLEDIKQSYLEKIKELNNQESTKQSLQAIANLENILNFITLKQEFIAKSNQEGLKQYVKNYWRDMVDNLDEFLKLKSTSVLTADDRKTIEDCLPNNDAIKKITKNYEKKRRKFEKTLRPKEQTLTETYLLNEDALAPLASLNQLDSIRKEIKLTPSNFSFSLTLSAKLKQLHTLFLHVNTRYQESAVRYNLTQLTEILSSLKQMLITAENSTTKPLAKKDKNHYIAGIWAIFANLPTFFKTPYISASQKNDLIVMLLQALPEQECQELLAKISLNKDYLINKLELSLPEEQPLVAEDQDQRQNALLKAHVNSILDTVIGWLAAPQSLKKSIDDAIAAQAGPAQESMVLNLFKKDIASFLNVFEVIVNCSIKHQLFPAKLAKPFIHQLEYVHTLLHTSTGSINDQHAFIAKQIYELVDHLSAFFFNLDTEKVETDKLLEALQQDQDQIAQNLLLRLTFGKPLFALLDDINRQGQQRLINFKPQPIKENISAKNVARGKFQDESEEELEGSSSDEENNTDFTQIAKVSTPVKDLIETNSLAQPELPKTKKNWWFYLMLPFIAFFKRTLRKQEFPNRQNSNDFSSNKAGSNTDLPQNVGIPLPGASCSQKLVVDPESFSSGLSHADISAALAQPQKLVLELNHQQSDNFNDSPTSPVETKAYVPSLNYDFQQNNNSPLTKLNFKPSPAGNYISEAIAKLTYAKQSSNQSATESIENLQSNTLHMSVRCY